jgi:ABC-type multidrug transport system ATPase subunit
LSHDLQLYSELTARENLLFFGRLYRVPHPSAAAAAALEHASLADRAGDIVQSFSRGMRQRLALERALLHQPALLLLDEPFTGLDETSALALIRRLKELRADGRIVLLATHDLDTAEAILDKAIVLRDGRVVATETSIPGLRQAYRAHLSS